MTIKAIYQHYEGTDSQCDAVQKKREITWATDIGESGALRYYDCSGNVHYLYPGVSGSTGGSVFWSEKTNQTTYGMLPNVPTGLYWNKEDNTFVQIGEQSNRSGVFIGYFDEVPSWDNSVMEGIHIISAKSAGYDGKSKDVIGANNLWLCGATNLILDSYAGKTQMTTSTDLELNIGSKISGYVTDGIDIFSEGTIDIEAERYAYLRVSGTSPSNNGHIQIIANGSFEADVDLLADRDIDILAGRNITASGSKVEVQSDKVYTEGGAFTPTVQGFSSISTNDCYYHRLGEVVRVTVNINGSGNTAPTQFSLPVEPNSGIPHQVGTTILAGYENGGFFTNYTDASVAIFPPINSGVVMINAEGYGGTYGDNYGNNYSKWLCGTFWYIANEVG